MSAGTWTAARAATPTLPGTCRARCSWISTAGSPARPPPRRAGTRCPIRPSSPTAWPGSGSPTTARSWLTTTPGARSRPGWSGCCGRRGTPPRCSTAVSRPTTARWSRRLRRPPRGPGRPKRPPRRARRARRPGSRRVPGRAASWPASRTRPIRLMSSWTPATGPGTAVTPSRSIRARGTSPAPGACPAARTWPRTGRSCPCRSYGSGWPAPVSRRTPASSATAAPA